MKAIFQRWQRLLTVMATCSVSCVTVVSPVHAEQKEAVPLTEFQFPLDKTKWKQSRRKNKQFLCHPPACTSSQSIKYADASVEEFYQKKKALLQEGKTTKESLDNQKQKFNDFYQKKKTEILAQHSSLPIPYILEMTANQKDMWEETITKVSSDNKNFYFITRIYYCKEHTILVEAAAENLPDAQQVMESGIVGLFR